MTSHEIFSCRSLKEIIGCRVFSRELVDFKIIRAREGSGRYIKRISIYLIEKVFPDIMLFRKNVNFTHRHNILHILHININVINMQILLKLKNYHFLSGFNTWTLSNLILSALRNIIKYKVCNIYSAYINCYYLLFYITVSLFVT